MAINKKKSAILPLLINHERMPKEVEYQGYPIVREYKYLGVRFNNKVQVDADTTHKRKKAKHVLRQLNRLANKIQNVSARNLVYNALSFQKTNYMSEILATTSKDAKKFLAVQMGLKFTNTYNLHEKTERRLLWQAIGRETPDMVVRRKILKLEGKMRRMGEPIF